MTTLDCGFVLPESVRQELLAKLQEMMDDFNRFSESMEKTRAVSKVEEAMVREKAEALECASNLKIPASVYDMDSHVKEMEVEELSKKSTSGNGGNVAHQLFDQMPLKIASKEKRRKSLKAWKFKFKSTSKRSRLLDSKFSFVDATVLLNKDSLEIIMDCVKKEFEETMAGCEKKKKGLKSWMFKYKKGNKKRDLLLLNGKASLALRAIGTGLETVERDSSNQEKSRLCTEDKGGLKGCLERLQASVLRKEESESMVVNEVKAEFKTFDRKRSDRTLSLEDKQDDEHEQNQVIKLISSLNNRIWEPGGVLIEHDRWKDLEKCYKHGRLRRLMQPLSSMWWQLSKSREFEKLGACSLVDIKTWMFKYKYEFPRHYGFDIEALFGVEFYELEYMKLHINHCFAVQEFYGIHGSISGHWHLAFDPGGIISCIECDDFVVTHTQWVGHDKLEGCSNDQTLATDVEVEEKQAYVSVLQAVIEIHQDSHFVFRAGYTVRALETLQVGNNGAETVGAEQLKRRRQQKFHKTRQSQFKQQPRRNMVYTTCLRILRRGKEQGRSTQVKLFKNWKFKYKHKHPFRILPCNAQHSRKQMADQQGTERDFAIGDYVFVKMQPYRQKFVVLRSNQKLAPKYYGPYKIIGRCGEVAYKLQLPEHSQIHPVFHVSQLKVLVGNVSTATQLPSILPDAFEKVPELVRERKMVRRQGRAATKVLVKWVNEPEEEATGEFLFDLLKQYPQFDAYNLEDKVL